MSKYLNLVGGLTKVTDIFSAAYAEIVGTKDKVFNSGSPLQLVCVLTLATARPDYIFWSVDNMISTVTLHAMPQNIANAFLDYYQQDLSFINFALS